MQPRSLVGLLTSKKCAAQKANQNKGVEIKGEGDSSKGKRWAI